MDSCDDLLHPLKITGLIGVVLRRQSLDFHRDCFLTILRIGMIGEKLWSLLSASCIQLVKETRQLHRIVSGLSHEVRAHEIRLAFVGAGKLEQHTVRPQAYTHLRELSQHRTARHLGAQERGEFDQLTL